jgi:hypothetical protein
MFFGSSFFSRRFTDQEIATHCSVSLDTVYRWRTGKRGIPKGYRRLLDWIGGGRLLPESWRGWRFEGDELVSPLHDRFNAVSIEQFRMLYEALQSMQVMNRQLHEYIDYLESVAPKAEVIPIDRDRMRPSATDGHEFNQLFQKEGAARWRL